MGDSSPPRCSTNTTPPNLLIVVDQNKMSAEGATPMSQVQASSLQKGGLVMLSGRPCIIDEYRPTPTDIIISGYDIIDPQERKNGSFPPTANVDVPVVGPTNSKDYRMKEVMSPDEVDLMDVATQEIKTEMIKVQQTEENFLTLEGSTVTVFTYIGENGIEKGIIAVKDRPARPILN